MCTCSAAECGTLEVKHPDDMMWVLLAIQDAVARELVPVTAMSFRFLKGDAGSKGFIELAMKKKDRL